MGIFSRIKSLVAGAANDGMDNLEAANLDTVIRQSIREMEADLAKVTSDSASAIAECNRLEKQYDDLVKSVADWDAKAEQAVNNDREDLAVKALEKSGELDAQRLQLEPVLKQAKNTAANLRKRIDQYQKKINQAKLESKTLIARNSAAQAQKKLAAAASGVGAGAGGAFEKLERLNAKVQENEAHAEAWEDLGTSEDDKLAEEFASMGTSSANDRLAALKQKMGK
jgi:phage shock protein A